jgi:NADP-reducing hydrogenase subunit HndD
MTEKKQHITLTIDQHQVSVLEGTTVLEAAKKVGIDIPTLCHMKLHDMGIENKPAGCRVCVVEVEGRKNLAPSCVTLATEGMKIRTNSVRVLNARQTVLELILSDHPADCLVCIKSGNCDLQSMAQRFNIRNITYKGEQSTYREDFSPSVIREMDKCIMCRRCEMMCNQVQTVGALSGVNRGFMAVVSPAFEQDLQDSVCTFCGQCVAVCPTGALTEVNHTSDVIKSLADPRKTVIVQTAPAVRAALGEAFGLEPGTLVTGKLVSALKELGVCFRY